MRKRLACRQPLVLTMLLGLGLVSGASRAMAHDALSLTHDALLAGGGRLDAGPSLCALTAMGEAGGGRAANGRFSLQGGSQLTLHPPPAGARAIAVDGAVDEATQTLVVNGVAASRSGPGFRAEGVRLLEGPNPITVTATDLGGNRSERTITVWLDTQPPVRPTVEAPPAVTAASPLTLTGTKTNGTSLWINGVEAMPFGGSTTWSVTVTLVEGDHLFSLVTQDEVDHRSTAATVTVVLDTLPPVLTVTVPAVTNVTPLLVQGAVDDSLTRVEANGLVAARAGTRFDVAVPLTQGSNPITITATSPNGYVTTKTLTVILGTIPTITAIQPAEGSLLDAETPVTITASATDEESNPIQYQLWLDGQLLVDWATNASYVWTPTPAQEGLHIIEARVQDGFGGLTSKQAETCVVLKAIAPPP